MQQRFKKSKHNKISAACHDSVNENKKQQGLIKPFFNTRKFRIPKKEPNNIIKTRIPRNLKQFSSISDDLNFNSDEKNDDLINFENFKSSNEFLDFDNFDFDTDPPFYIKFESDLLPLCYFDDDDYETVNFAQLKDDIKNKETITGKSILIKSFELKWAPVLILDFCDDHSTFLVEYVDNDIRKYVGRLNLQINPYDDDSFFQRRNEAIQRREIFIRNQRFFAYLEYKLDPNQSILTQKVTQKVISMIPKELKTNFQLIENLLTEVKMNEVFYYFTEEYIIRLKKDEKFVEKCKKLSFPTLTDFEPNFKIKQLNIQNSSSFHELAQKMIGVMKISTKNVYEETMKVKIRARILSELQLFEIDYNDHNVLKFARNIKLQIEGCVNIEFAKKMREMKQEIKHLPFFDENLAHCIDKIIISSISEVTLNAIDDLYESFASKNVYFIYNYSYFKPISFDLEIKALLSIIDSITQCWKKASCRSTFTIVSSEDEILLPNSSLLSLHLQRLRNYINYALKNQFDEVQNEINKFFQKFGDSYLIETFDPVFRKKLTGIDADLYVSTIACSGSFIPASQILTNRQIIKLENISKKLEKDVIEIIPTKIDLNRSNVKVLFRKAKQELISKIESMNNHIKIILFLHTNSLIEQLQAKLKMTYDKVSKEPDNIAIFLELRSFYKEVPLILKKMENKRNEVSSIIKFFESSKSPLAHVLNQRFFEFKFKMHLFIESFPLRESKLEEAKEDISTNHASIEADVLSKLAEYEKELNFIVQQNVKDNISEMCDKTKETYEKFKVLQPVVVELNLGKGVLVHNPFDQSRFERSLNLSYDMYKLWEMVKDITDLNADIASRQIQQLNVRSLFEKCHKWTEEQQRIRESILYYPIAKNVSDKLANTIKEFTNYLSIIEVITSPLLRQRHISMIRELFASNPKNYVDSSSTFYELISIKILDLKEQFAKIYEIAKSEYKIEKNVRNIVNDLIMLSVRLRIKNLKEFLINTQHLMNNQKNELIEIKKSEFSLPFLDKIELHLKLISDLTNVFIILNENINIYYELKSFITAEDTKKRNPSLFESFKAVRLEFSKVLQSINYINIFLNKEIIFKEILSNFNQINERLPIYIFNRKSEYIRFQILTNEEFFNLVSSSHSIESLSPNIRYILPNVSTFMIASKNNGNENNDQIFVEGVKSFDDEILHLNEPVQYTIDRIDFLFENIIKSIQKTIHSQVFLLINRNFQYFLKQFPQLPFQVSFLYLNIRFTEILKNKKNITNFEQLKSSMNEFRSILDIANEIIQSENTKKSLNSLIQYFLSIFNQINVINKWMGSRNILPIDSSNGSHISNDDQNVEHKRGRNLKLSKSQKRGSMYSLNINSLFNTKREKTPKFIKFVVENEQIFVKAKKFSIEYQYEYMGNNYNAMNFPDVNNIESFLESISYNQSCCIPVDSLTANKFLFNVSVIIGRQLLSIHLANNYFMANYNDFLKCIELNSNFILHLSEFDSVPTHIQCSIAEFVDNNKINGILVSTDSMLSPFHFTYLRPIIIPKNIDNKILCIYGANERIKKEKVQEISNLNNYQQIIEIKNLNDFKIELTNQLLIWFRCSFSLQMFSIFEKNSFILKSNGSRIFFNNNCNFIFDFISKREISDSIKSNFQWIDASTALEEWNFLTKIIGSYEPIEFCLEHASRIPFIQSNQQKTKLFVFSLIKELFPSLTNEINEAVIQSQINENQINLFDIISYLIENKQSIIIIGNGKKIEMLQSIIQYFNKFKSENKINLFINLFDFEENKNDSNLFIDIVDDSSSISLEKGRFYQFLPFSIDSKIESNCFETNVLEEAYQFLNENFVLFSLFCGFNDPPSKASVSDYLIVPPDQSFTEYLTNLLSKDIKHLTFIFVQCQSFQFSSILNFNFSKTKIEKLINIRILLITPLIKSDFEYFCGSTSYFKVICRNGQKSLLKSRQLNLQSQNSMNQKFKEKKIDLDENYKTISEKQADRYYPLYLQYFKSRIEKRISFLNEFLNSFSSSLEFEEKCNSDFNNATQFLHQCNVDLENAKSQLAVADSALKHEIEETNNKKSFILKPKLEFEESKRDQIDNEIQSKIPYLQKAEKFMSSIDQTTVFMIRGIRSPTPSVLPIFECFAIIFNIKPESKLVGKNRIIDYFPPVQKMMKDSKFFLTMLTFSKQNIEVEKVTRLKNLLSNSKSIMERSIKNNKDFSAIVKWFQYLVSSNEIRNELAPLYQSLEYHKKEVTSIQTEIECLNQKVDYRKKAIEDIKSLISKLLIDIKNAERQLVIIDSRKSNTINFNQELKEEVLHFQNEYEMLNEKLKNASDICFARTFCVCYSSSLSYNDHLKSRKNYGRSFNLELSKEIQRKLHLNGLTDQVLKEKMAAVLDEFTTPIIFDPDGFCFKLLREVYSNAQIIFGFQELDENLPTIAVIEDLRESLFVKNYYSKSFIISKYVPTSNVINSSLSKYFIFVDFSITNTFDIFRENLFVAFHSSNFESISKYDDQIDEVNQKKISIIEKINTSLRKNPLDFFEGGSWKNCLLFLADTKSSIESLLKDMNRIKEISFQSDPFSRITAKFSQNLFEYLRKIIGSNSSAAVLAIMIDIVNTFHKPVEIFEKVKQLFQLSYQYSFENISISFVGSDFTISFPKFTSPIEKVSIKYHNEKFESIEKNVQKKFDDYKNQFFRFSEEIQVNSEELIDLSINENSKFSLKKIILSISSHFPIVFKASVQDDPTKYLFTIGQCKTLILTEKYESNLLRFNGWIICRYPDLQDNGFVHLKQFLSDLLTSRQYPQKFRFIIIVNDSTEIPFYLTQTSIIMNLPVLLPPSKIFAKITKKVDEKMMNNNIKENIQIVANFIGSLSLFSRPTIASDLLKQKFLDVMKIKSCPLLPDRMFYIKQINSFWLQRVLNLKNLKKRNYSFDFSYASISLKEIDGSLPVDSISTLDCEIKNGLFVKVNRFYPIPIGRVWLIKENVKSNDNSFDKYNSVLFGGNPVKQILLIKSAGDSNCHFLLEQ